MLAEHADEIVIPASSWNGAQLCSFVGEDNLVNDACVVVESSGKGEVEGDLSYPFHRLQIGEQLFHIFHSLT